MIHVRVTYLPATSALSLHFSNGKSAWDLHAHLMADMVTAWTGRQYDRNGEKAEAQREVTERREQRRESARKRARAHNNRTVADDIARAKRNARGGE